ncbi:hypothetical protein CYMTET_21178, partial [Cymbomonas tetramitiformis]
MGASQSLSAEAMQVSQLIKTANWAATRYPDQSDKAFVGGCFEFETNVDAADYKCMENELADSFLVDVEKGEVFSGKQNDDGCLLSLVQVEAKPYVTIRTFSMLVQHLQVAGDTVAQEEVYALIKACPDIRSVMVQGAEGKENESLSFLYSALFSHYQEATGGAAPVEYTPEQPIAHMGAARASTLNLASVTQDTDYGARFEPAPEPPTSEAYRMSELYTAADIFQKIIKDKGSTTAKWRKQLDKITKEAAQDAEAAKDSDLEGFDPMAKVIAPRVTANTYVSGSQAYRVSSWMTG